MRVSPTRRVRTFPGRRGLRSPVRLAAVAIAMAATPAHGQESTLRGEIDLAIGVMDGAREYLFENIGALARDAAGRIYVGDSGARDVRVYGPDGGYLFQVSGPGEGPGEFRRGVCSLVFDPDGRLWVDARDSYKVFDILGDRTDHVRDVPPPDEVRRIDMGQGNTLVAGGTTSCVNPMFTGPTGLVLAADSVGVDENNDYVIERQQVTIGPEGDVVSRATLPQRDLGDTSWPILIWRHPNRGEQEMQVRPPFANRNIRAHSPDGRSAHLYTRDYHVQVFDIDGELLYEIRRDSEGPLITEAEAGLERGRLDEMRDGMAEALVEFPTIEMPERKPPVGDMWFDEDGRLWVRLAWAEADEVLRAHVYDPAGEMLFTAEWPRGIDLSLGGVSGDVALGVQRMEFDVQRVVRLRFSPP